MKTVLLFIGLFIIMVLHLVTYKYLYYEIGANCQLVMGGFWGIILIVLLAIKKNLKRGMKNERSN
jgi:bacteriorhodopsin